MDIDDKVAVITGGASGLGRATAEHLVARGARVAIFDIQTELGGQLAWDLGERVLFVEVDVRSEDSVAAGIEAVLARFGQIHICVNCAGTASASRTVGRGGPHSLEDFRAIVDLNLVGSFNVLRLCAARMVAQESVNGDGERGVIVNTASIAASDGQIGQVAYAASKAGVSGMTLTIARDLGKLGVRCCAIQPGIMKTALLGQLPLEMQEALAAHAQFPRRMGRPEEFAALVAHIVENRYLNGESIRLDGAARMPP